MPFEIYRITRPSIDDAAYYGQHCRTPDPGYFGSGVRILRSIKKYGIDAHKKDIIHIVQTQNEANLEEIKIIKEALDKKENILNLDPGGRCKDYVRIMSNETRQKLIDSHKGQGLGKVLTAEHRAKISKSHLGVGKGRKLSVEHKEKISKILKGRSVSIYLRNKQKERNLQDDILKLEGAIPVIDTTNWKAYNSISEASRNTGNSISYIARQIKPKLAKDNRRKRIKFNRWILGKWKFTSMGNTALDCSLSLSKAIDSSGCVAIINNVCKLLGENYGRVERKS
jgi:hypothetical protein